VVASAAATTARGNRFRPVSCASQIVASYNGASLDCRLRKRRLQPVVSPLPAPVVKVFAAKDERTFGQAKRVAQDLRRTQSVRPYNPAI
jgi:hypothetical protein